ncbi:MAG: HPr family phosphocarrier protein [Candidatus Hydrogenedentota bacterium]
MNTDELKIDPQNINLTPAELKAIEDRKYYMSLEQKREVSIEEAIIDFIKNYAESWKREKQRIDNLAQKQEILDRNISPEEWVKEYAHIWREERESLEKSGFLTLIVTIKNEKGLHMGPSSKISNLVSKYDCDVYAHNMKGMMHYNFTLNDKKYLNVKSLLGFLGLAAIKGDIIEFIATGHQSKEALIALKDLIDTKLE